MLTIYENFQPYSTETVATKTNFKKAKTEMVDELSKIGFKVPTNLTLNVVKTLYIENIGYKSSDARVGEIENTLSAADSFPSDTQTASTETQSRIYQGLRKIRRFELDAYEENIIEISNFYGQKFYDYHKLFSARAATLLQEKQIKVDWIKRDSDLMILIRAGVEINICKLCHMVGHDTKFCPLQPSEESVSTQHLMRNGGHSDIRGRKRFYHNGKEICNNFNSMSCSNKDGRCLFLHMCSNCRNFDLRLIACHRQSTQNDTEKNRKNHTFKNTVTKTGTPAPKQNFGSEK
ncbi:unnamed protein product [Mytilus coruscus]|uniref:C3H1-type domain-containing protein n=1 Tax=Mytilus coruscus TaxID=42192 RepID=A0A6J8E1Y4_MYTCO|nr:unnamed protein product [Mytilus coruscus]